MAARESYLPDLPRSNIAPMFLWGRVFIGDSRVGCGMLSRRGDSLRCDHENNFGGKVLAISRRLFLGALAASTALGKTRKAHAQAPIVAYTRRDVNLMSADDPVVATYRDAVAEMQSLPDTNPLSWEHQARIHLNYCPHGNWFFLPWHRAYLAQFEDIIREISGNRDWALPYWDWTRNPQIPSPFWVSSSSLNHPRNAGPTTNMPAEFVGLPVIEDIMRKRTFEEFASFKSSAPYNGSGGGTAELEGRPHNNVHVTIGQDMVTFMSPRDPIFWLHHCNIDRIWASWNSAGNVNTTDPDLSNFIFAANQPDRTGTINPSQFVNSDGTPRSFAVADLYATGDLGYLYDRLEPAPQTSFDLAVRSFSVESAMRETVSSELSRSVASGVALETAVSLEPEAVNAVAETGQIQTFSSSSVQDFTLPRIITTATLKLRGLRAAASPETTFRVFINCDYLTLETPINDPHYVGSASFFLNGVEADGHAHEAGADFVFDLTNAVDALMRTGTLTNGLIRPQVLAFTPEGTGTELAIDGAFEITVETLG